MKYPNLNPSYVQKETVTIDKGIIKSKQTLPKEVKEAFLTITDKADRNAYVCQLNDVGWSLTAIAEAVGVTREMTRLIAKDNTSSPSFEVLGLPMPLPPRKIITKQVRKPIDPEVLKKLKELHAVAKLIRGRTTKYRKEAEEFTKMIHDLTLEGVSTYTVAKELGLTVGAVNFRLVHYGYKNTTGKSRVLTQRTQIKYKGE
jgi:hypothetical protein